jgi:hypothetical protein
MTEQDLRDALEAIVLGAATDEAYEVAEDAGWRELFRGCIYKIEGEKKQMDATTARSIITQARKDETYGGEMPEDDAACIQAAEELVDMAKQAWDQYIRGPEVEVILKLAENGNGGDPKAEAAPPEQQAEPEADDQTDDEEVAPPQDLTGVNEQLMRVEPWEGYNEDRVKDITEGINIALESDDEPADLLAHIWAYESSHKNRVRILKHVKAAWERVSGQENPAEQGAEDRAKEPEARAEVSEPTADGESVGEARVGDDVQSAERVSQEEDAKRVSGGGEVESDAGTEPVGEAGQPRTEDRRAEHAEQEAPKDRAYATLVSAVDRQLANERLDIPKPPSDSVPELPWKWNDVSDGDLRDLHMQYASLAYYKTYQQSREERIAMHCKEAADEISNKLLINTPKYDEKGKEIKVTLLEAQISSDENVKKWRRLQRQHEMYALTAKREAESYQKLVEALSRLETMRHNAWERARR